MKTLKLENKNWLMVLAMMFIGAFPACSDSDDGGEVTAPVFPEPKDINCAAGETAEISFEANMDWEISSNAGWCKFKNGEFAESLMNGKAGKQTITITTSADGQNYNETAIAEITLKMGNQSQVIYKVSRAPKAYADLVVTDEAGNVYDKDHPLTINGNSTSSSVYTVIKAQAEAGMKIGFTNPEWLSFSIDEKAGTYSFTFNKENSAGLNEKYPIARGNYVLTFTTADASTAKTDKVRKVEIPLVYAGLQQDAIKIDPTYMNATVSVDGQEIVSEKGTSKQLASTITAYNDEFQVVAFKQTLQDGKYVYDFDNKVEWLHATLGTGTAKDLITVSVDNNPGEEREATVMVFPKAVYEKIKGDLAGNIVDSSTGDIATLYSVNIMTTLKQEARQKQADRVTFSADYYFNPDATGATEIKFPHVESNMNTKVKFEDMKDAANVDDYGVTGNNVWKAVIPGKLVNEFTPTGMKLVFEGVGMATGQQIIEKEENSAAAGMRLEGNTYDPKGNPKKINGWGIYFNDPENYQNDYQLIVRGEDNAIIALCIIEIVSDSEN